MTNKLSRAYESIDRGLVTIANAVVKPYNWATGGTKAQLANRLLDGLPIGFTINTLNTNIVFGGVLSPIMLLLTHSMQKQNSYIENRELSAREKNCLDQLVESKKKICTQLALFYGALGIADYVLACVDKRDGYIIDNKTSDIIGAIGWGLASLSNVVMKADYVPPRKSVIERTQDKFIKLIEEHKQKQAALPLPSLFYN